MHDPSMRRAALLLAFALLAGSATAQAPLPSAPSQVVEGPPPAPPMPPLAIGPLEPPAPPAPAEPVVVDPRKPQRPIAALSSVRPTYPRDQVCLGISGTVSLVVTIGADDSVLQVNVERSTRSRALDRAAMDAVRRARWQAEIVNGKPVTSRVRLPVEFVLDGLPRDYCRRIDIALLDNDGSDVFAGKPVHAQLELYVTGPTELLLQWRRLAVPPQSEAVVHEERRRLQRAVFEQRTTFNVAPPQSLSPGRYALEALIDGELRGQREFEVR